MQILLLGGTGVISREIARQAIAGGHELILFNRGSKTLDLGGQARSIIGDRHNHEDFASKMKPLRPDVVIDMISYNADDARQTVEIFSQRAGQMIFTSSVAAYERPYRSFPIREECERLTNDPSFLYGYHKARLEDYLTEAMTRGGAPITIIRPSLTFGEGGANIGALRQNANIIHRIRQGKPLLLFGDGTILWSFTFAEDLAKGYLLCCRNPNTYNEAFHVANDTVGLWKDLYDTFARLAGREAIYAYAPTRALHAALPPLFEHIEYEKKYCAIFDCSKFKKAAPAFRATVSLEEGLGKIVAWWERQGAPLDEARDALEDIICEHCASFETELSRALRGITL